MLPEVRIEHRYPAALSFLREQGPQALAVLHALLGQSERRDGGLVAQASTRELADRLRFLSKDSVHRCLRQLARAGVVEPVDRQPGSAFRATTYLIHLDESGITVVPDGRSA